MALYVFGFDVEKKDKNRVKVKRHFLYLISNFQFLNYFKVSKTQIKLCVLFKNVV